jgi:hypothetical protein
MYLENKRHLSETESVLIMYKWLPLVDSYHMSDCEFLINVQKCVCVFVWCVFMCVCLCVVWCACVQTVTAATYEALNNKINFILHSKSPDCSRFRSVQADVL